MVLCERQRMGTIDFTVTHHFDAPASAVWSELVDWPAHGKWIPATRVVVDPGDPQAVGTTLTGYTGYGPLTLVDRMRIAELTWDDGDGTGYCEVEKLGPVLQGKAGFHVLTDGAGSRVEWFETVTVKFLPGLLDPIVTKLSAQGFSFGMKRLAKVIAKKGIGPATTTA